VRIQTLIAAATAGLVSLLGCTQARTLEGEARRTSWVEDVGPLLAANCASCHSGSGAFAGYRTTSYLEALGPKGAPVAVSGDRFSKLILTFDPPNATSPHRDFAKVAANRDLLYSWVVDSNLSYTSVGPHAGGILNPNDAREFHGALLSDHSWDLAYCAKCHAADFTGGASKVACTSCHTAGNTQANSCTTCHGNPPANGSHVAHLSGKNGLKLACSSCHIQPGTWSDPDHLGTKAVVKFGDLAAQAGTGRTGAPAFDGVSCSNVYCHGGAFADAKATSPKPAWGGAATGACGSCHGLPPASHAPTSTDCSQCHWLTVAKDKTFINAALHINGKVEVGDGTGSCTACHGSGTNPAPPRDTKGNTDPSFVSVGAHQAHLSGEHGISGAIACSACHLVPTAVGSPGHVDHDPPATLKFSGLAVADGATPSWNHDTASCSATYCHGGGTKLGTDTTSPSATNRTPKWTGGSAQIFCGSCHGIPPANASHPLKAGNVPMQLSDCYTCHASTVDKLGNLIVTGPPGARVSTHINGVVDVSITP
jgi:predicted CxxxxCH...CXXCH cytochrome family protein